MFGHRSLYHDGWRAVCPWPGTSFVESGLGFGAPIDYDELIELDAKGWELYNLNADFAETSNLAENERDRLIAMIGMWYVEAGKYNVLPIDSRGTARLAEERPQIAAGRKKYTYYAGTQVVPPNAAPRLLNVPHSVSVHANVPKGGAEGVLFCMGGVDGGYVFYVKDGKLTYGYNYVADQRFKVQSNGGGVPEGDHIFSFEFTPTGKPDIAHGKGVPAKIKLFVDRKEVGSGHLPVTIPLTLGLSAGVSVGANVGSPVMTDYEAPFAFTGTVKKALVDVTGELIDDKAAQMRMYLARQ
jgi:arylsulfatase